MIIKKHSKEKYKQGFSNNNMLGTSGHLPNGKTLKEFNYRYHVLMYLLNNKSNYLQITVRLCIHETFSIAGCRAPVLIGIGQRGNLAAYCIVYILKPHVWIHGALYVCIFFSTQSNLSWLFYFQIQLSVLDQRNFIFCPFPLYSQKQNNLLVFNISLICYIPTIKQSHYTRKREGLDGIADNICAEF